MPNNVFLSGLGAMGRRHLAGLLRAGCRVTALDPSEKARSLARGVAAAHGASEALELVDEAPRGAFSGAVFAEPAPFRVDNVAGFLDGARADRILLEKPVASAPDAVARALELCGGRAAVNLSRRLWPFTRRIESLAGESRELVVTLNGGAKGLGCNAVHYLNLFLFVARAGAGRVAYSRLSPIPVQSPRGAGFRDFGGTFVVEAGRGIFFASLAAESSAPPVLSIRGDHFTAWVDESDWTFRVQARNPASGAPNHLYGRDYETLDSGKLVLPDPEAIAESWARGRGELPSLESAAPAHALLFDVLARGGAAPPFHFT